MLIKEFDFNNIIKKDEMIVPVFMQYGKECFEFINDNNAMSHFLQLFYFKLSQNEKYKQFLDNLCEKNYFQILIKLIQVLLFSLKINHIFMKIFIVRKKVKSTILG